MILRTLALALLASGALLAQQQRGGKEAGGPGEFHGDLRDRQGVMMRAHMLAPGAMPPLRTLALLLVYHGMNGNENNYYGGTVEALKRLKCENEFVVIAGKSKGPGWTLEDDGPITRRVIEWAKEKYPIDPRQVFIWGSSNGAGFIGKFGWENQDLVAAAIGYCGGYNFASKEKLANAADSKVEWYFVHGGNDNPQNSGNACKQLKEMGIRYVFRQLDGYGHTDIWDGQGHPDMTVVNDCRDDYITWLRGLRHKTMELPKRDQEQIAAFENKGRAESLLGNKGTYLNLQRIGGLAASPAILAGLQSKSAGVRAAAAEACGRSSFGTAVAEELAKLAHDENDRVAATAIHALGTYAAWHYPEAFDALCGVVAGDKGDSSKGPSAGERLLAVEGLARALRLAALGNFEDKKAWWTLVRGLDDDDVKVRATAFAALQRANKDAFGYQPGAVLAARKDAVGKWTAWVTQKCGAAPDKEAK
jgi:poly(3-hydroxybutyrate) depolymerase